MGVLQHLGPLGASSSTELTRLPGSPGSPLSPFCPPEGPCNDNRSNINMHKRYQHSITF